MRFQLSSVVFIVVFAVIISCTPSRKYLEDRNLQTPGSKKYIRVLIITTEREIIISSKGKLKLQEKKSGKILHNKAESTIRLTPGRILDTITAESWGSTISVNGKNYRGMLEFSIVLGKIAGVNIVEIEDYIKGVVPGEVPSGWKPEVLKAQAVAARSYAYYHLIRNQGRSKLYDLDSTINFQVYKGASAETKTTNYAVEATAGEIITSRGRPVLAYFHSTCGGSTASGQSVWSGSKYNYLKGVKCVYCKDSPNYSWEYTLSIYDIKNALSKKFKNTGTIKNISFSRKEERISSIEILHGNERIVMTGNDFRLMFPPKTIKSMKFRSQKKENNIILAGKGWGHGVGMCQWGARGMAEKGMNYKIIINHYFSDVAIEKFVYKDSKLIADYSR